MVDKWSGPKDEGGDARVPTALDSKRLGQSCSVSSLGCSRSQARQATSSRKQLSSSAITGH
eukprot:4929184-Amphidinium_carterae.1